MPSMWTYGKDYGVFVFPNANWMIVSPEKYYYTDSFLKAVLRYIKWNAMYKGKTIVFEHSRSE